MSWRTPWIPQWKSIRYYCLDYIQYYNQHLKYSRDTTGVWQNDTRLSSKYSRSLWEGLYLILMFIWTHDILPFLLAQPPVQQTVVAKPTPHTRTQVRALYTHTANTDTQLSFCEGDIILVIGEKREGWQYGENIKTNR